jgi:ubiquinone/menaquinone biosynthesis methyltransferase
MPTTPHTESSPITEETASARQTHFGFRDVQLQEKEKLVRGVFDSVASRYDLMNDLMSAGLHRYWKREMTAWLQPRCHERQLDVAGGTGDIAFRCLEAMKQDATRKQQALTGEVAVCDINPAMLQQGKARAIDRNLLEGLSWHCGNAEKLPFADKHFDSYTIAFGIRNVTDIQQALQEAYRVVKPGGRFACLEFSRVAVAPVRTAYDAYSFRVIPALGQKITGDREAYQYLVESIRRFPPQEDFAQMIEKAGFRRVKWRNFQLGVVALHTAWKV